MSNRLYVGNLSLSTTEDTIVQAFEQDDLGVRSINVVLDRGTGQTRGFAFVDMATEADALAAAEALDGTVLDGCTLRVNVVHEWQQRSNRARKGRDERDF